MESFSSVPQGSVQGAMPSSGVSLAESSADTSFPETDSEEPVSDVSVAASLDSSYTESEGSTASCEEHIYGETPVETVGNLDIYECTICGYRNVVPNGILIGETGDDG